MEIRGCKIRWVWWMTQSFHHNSLIFSSVRLEQCGVALWCDDVFSVDKNRKHFDLIQWFPIQIFINSLSKFQHSRVNNSVSIPVVIHLERATTVCVLSLYGVVEPIRCLWWIVWFCSLRTVYKGSKHSNQLLMFLDGRPRLVKGVWHFFNCLTWICIHFCY